MRSSITCRNGAPCGSRPRESRHRGAKCRDTGEEHFTPQLVSTLAEPFNRGAQRMRSDHAGVGLGLAIVNSITGAHDGTPDPYPSDRWRALRHGAITRRGDASPAGTITGIGACPGTNIQACKSQIEARGQANSICSMRVAFGGSLSTPLRRGRKGYGRRCG